jgi:hypothetical protein
MRTKLITLVYTRTGIGAEPTPPARKNKPRGAAKRERQQRAASAELAALWHQPKGSK